METQPTAVQFLLDELENNKELFSSKWEKIIMLVEQVKEIEKSQHAHTWVNCLNTLVQKIHDQNFRDNDMHIDSKIGDPVLKTLVYFHNYYDETFNK